MSRLTSFALFLLCLALTTSPSHGIRRLSVNSRSSTPSPTPGLWGRFRGRVNNAVYRVGERIERRLGVTPDHKDKVKTDIKTVEGWIKEIKATFDEEGVCPSLIDGMKSMSDDVKQKYKEISLHISSIEEACNLANFTGRMKEGQAHLAIKCEEVFSGHMVDALVSSMQSWLESHLGVVWAADHVVTGSSYVTLAAETESVPEEARAYAKELNVFTDNPVLLAKEIIESWRIVKDSIKNLLTPYLREIVSPVARAVLDQFPEVVDTSTKIAGETARELDVYLNLQVDIIMGQVEEMCSK